MRTLAGQTLAIEKTDWGGDRIRIYRWSREREKEKNLRSKKEGYFSQA